MQREPLPPADERDDDELMHAAAVGERAAYEALVRRYQRRVRAYCTRWSGSVSVGDDIAQECFVEVWQRRRDYQAQGKFRAYLFRIAANRCKNQQRSRDRELRLVEADGSSRDDAASSERFSIHERSRVERGLRQLPELQREAVLLRYSAELDYAELACLLGVPQATARSRVFLGLMKLRKLLRVENEP